MSAIEITTCTACSIRAFPNNFLLFSPADLISRMIRLDKPKSVTKLNKATIETRYEYTPCFSAPRYLISAMLAMAPNVLPKTRDATWLITFVASMRELLIKMLLYFFLLYTNTFGMSKSYFLCYYNFRQFFLGNNDDKIYFQSLTNPPNSVGGVAKAQPP